MEENGEGKKMEENGDERSESKFPDYNNTNI